MSGESERADGDSEKRGGEVGWDEDDPRVLFVMNLVLSTVFVAVVVYSLSYIGLAAFSVVNIASTTLVLTAVIHLVTN